MKTVFVVFERSDGEEAGEVERFKCVRANRRIALDEAAAVKPAVVLEVPTSGDSDEPLNRFELT